MDDPKYNYNANCAKLRKQLRKRFGKETNPIKENATLTTEYSNEEEYSDNPQNYKKEESSFQIFPNRVAVSDIKERKPSIVPTVQKIKPKPKRRQAPPNPVTFDPLAMMMVSKTYVKTGVSLTLRVASFLLLYGTELIVQTLAMSTIALVMVLKFVDSFVRHRYLTVVIGYIEKINISSSKLPSMSMDLVRLVNGLSYILWIFSKMIQLLLLIGKHLIIQSVIGVVFLLYWVSSSIGFLVSHFVVVPAVDKTMNLLHLDSDTLSGLAQVQLDSILSVVIEFVYYAAANTSDYITSIGNLRHTISSVANLKEVVVGMIEGIRSLIEVIQLQMRDLLELSRMFLDLHETFLGILILMMNSLSQIGFMVYLLFQTLEYIGYVTGICTRFFMAASTALSRLHKI